MRPFLCLIYKHQTAALCTGPFLFLEILEMPVPLMATNTGIRIHGGFIFSLSFNFGFTFTMNPISGPIIHSCTHEMVEPKAHRSKRGRAVAKVSSIATVSPGHSAMFNSSKATIAPRGMRGKSSVKATFVGA